MTQEPLHLDNYPAKLLDAIVHVEMLRVLGKTCDVHGESVIISELNGLSNRLDWQGRSIRNTLLILGALTVKQALGQFHCLVDAKSE